MTAQTVKQSDATSKITKASSLGTANFDESKQQEQMVGDVQPARIKGKGVRTVAPKVHADRIQNTRTSHATHLTKRADFTEAEHGGQTNAQSTSTQDMRSAHAAKYRHPFHHKGQSHL